MNKPAEEVWSRVSPYLDRMLDLATEERGAWLDTLERSESIIAGRLRAYLAELAELERKDFLEAPARTTLAPKGLAGQRFGAYTLDREIGRGGAGAVWLAHRSDGRFEGQAAVKLPNVALPDHPSGQRVVREGTLLAKLQHPNIAHLLDAGVSPRGQPYLVLEYVRGVRIDEYCEMHRLSMERRIGLFLEVLAAVAHAHGKLIVHSDLKPSNILVTDDGVVKLLDFGVAALLPRDPGEPASPTDNIPIGLTPAYAAPEQLRGEAITAATDIYSLGVLLFVLVTGKHPIPPHEFDAAQIVRDRLDREAPRPSDVAEDIRRARLLRGDLDAIITMALRRKPGERYSTVTLFARDLRNYLVHEPLVARRRSLGYTVIRCVRRHRTIAAVAATIVSMLLVDVVSAPRAQRARDQSALSIAAGQPSDRCIRSICFGLGPVPKGSTLTERLELGLQRFLKQHLDYLRSADRTRAEPTGHSNAGENSRRADQLYMRVNRNGRSLP